MDFATIHTMGTCFFFVSDQFSWAKSKMEVNSRVHTSPSNERTGFTKTTDGQNTLRTAWDRWRIHDNMGQEFVHPQ